MIGDDVLRKIMPHNAGCLARSVISSPNYSWPVPHESICYCEFLHFEISWPALKLIWQRIFYKIFYSCTSLIAILQNDLNFQTQTSLRKLGKINFMFNCYFVHYILCAYIDPLLGDSGKHKSQIVCAQIMSTYVKLIQKSRDVFAWDPYMQSDLILYTLLFRFLKVQVQKQTSPTVPLQIPELGPKFSHRSTLAFSCSQRNVA